LCISEIKAIVYSLTKKMHYLLNVYTWRLLKLVAIFFMNGY
jgi:hypothetical protein